MIEIKELTCETKSVALNDLTLTVENGEIYLLMCSREDCTTVFADMMAGYKTIKTGALFLDAQEVTHLRSRPLTYIEQIGDTGFFDPGLELIDIVDYSTGIGKLERKRVLEILLLFNRFETDLKKKIRHVAPMDYKILALCLLLAKDNENLLIRDFMRGEEKEFELIFNRVLLQMKKEGKAILYLTGDIFYAYRVADRVSFVKNGYLVPAEPIISRDFKELDAMEVYKKYLS